MPNKILSYQGDTLIEEPIAPESHIKCEKGHLTIKGDVGANTLIHMTDGELTIIGDIGANTEIRFNSWWPSPLRQLDEGNKKQLEETLQAVKENSPYALGGLILDPWDDSERFDLFIQGNVLDDVLISGESNHTQALGNVHVTGCIGKNVNIKAYGDIRVKNIGAGSRLESHFGPIVCEDVADDVELKSYLGPIKAGQVGKARLEISIGSIFYTSLSNEGKATTDLVEGNWGNWLIESPTRNWATNSFGMFSNKLPATKINPSEEQTLNYII